MKSTIFVIMITFFIAMGFGVRSANGNYAQTQAKRLAAMDATDAANTKLNDLKNYVATHSGSTVTVVLTTAYNNAVQVAEAAAASTPSTQLYAAAQAACAGHAVSTVQAQCNEQYIQAHNTPVVAVAQPKLSDYTYHFVAPIITFDFVTILWVFAFIMIIVLILPVLRLGPRL
jgi:hypothetical protein